MRKRQRGQALLAVIIATLVVVLMSGFVLIQQGRMSREVSSEIDRQNFQSLSTRLAQMMDIVDQCTCNLRGTVLKKSGGEIDTETVLSKAFVNGGGYGGLFPPKFFVDRLNGAGSPACAGPSVTFASLDTASPPSPSYDNFSLEAVIFNGFQNLGSDPNDSTATRFKAHLALSGVISNSRQMVAGQSTAKKSSPIDIDVYVSVASNRVIQRCFQPTSAVSSRCPGDNWDFGCFNDPGATWLHNKCYSQGMPTAGKFHLNWDPSLDNYRSTCNTPGSCWYEGVRFDVSCTGKPDYSLSGQPGAIRCPADEWTFACGDDPAGGWGTNLCYGRGHAIHEGWHAEWMGSGYQAVCDWPGSCWNNGIHLDIQCANSPRIAQSGKNNRCPGHTFKFACLVSPPSDWTMNTCYSQGHSQTNQWHLVWDTAAKGYKMSCNTPGCPYEGMEIDVGCSM